MTFTTFELVTNLLLAPSEHRHLVRRTLRKRKQIAATAWALANKETCRQISDRTVLAFCAWPKLLSDPYS